MKMNPSCKGAFDCAGLSSAVVCTCLFGHLSQDWHAVALLISIHMDLAMVDGGHKHHRGYRRLGKTVSADPPHRPNTLAWSLLHWFD
jgi:hypothetical protein